MKAPFMNGDCCPETSDQILEVLMKIPLFDGLILAELHKIFDKHAQLLSRKANLRKANLRGANFLLTNLREADLTYSIGLTQDQIVWAIMDCLTQLPSHLRVFP